MSVERIIWLIIGLIFLVMAIVVLVSDGLNIGQDVHDAVQDGMIGILALGLAYRSDGRTVVR